MRPRTRQSRAHPVRQGITIALLALAALWLASLAWSLAGKAVFAWQTAGETKRQAQALAERKTALETSIATLQTPRGQEAAIRTAFGVARPGEQVIIVVPPAASTSTAPAPSWWRRALGWVGL
ncbi:MAG TPA: hypothetical protein VF829_01400 [Candidatus Paceibacterota bacterium]